jgi:hypothetical protein
VTAINCLPRHRIWAAAGEEQEQRRESDPWEDVFRSVKGIVCPNEEGRLEERVHTQELLLKLGIPTDKQKNQDAKRIGEAMRILRWSGPKMIRIGDKNMRGYWRTPRDGEGSLHVAAEQP